MPHRTGVQYIFADNQYYYLTASEANLHAVYIRRVFSVL